MQQFLQHEEIHEALFQDLIPSTSKFLWIATADIKDLHIARGRRKQYVTFLSLFADLISDGVEIRLIHAKEPGPRFREDFDRFPELIESERFERILCPRNHMKCVIADGKRAFFGSPNLTGAGMGAKSSLRRNFEVGLMSDEPEIVNALMATFDQIFMGEHCTKCERRDVCPDPIV